MKKLPFRKVAIVGVGLIGGSFALALRENKLAREIVGIGRRRESLAEALACGAVDRATLDLENGVAGADFVLLATPISAFPKIFERIGEVLNPEAIVSDVGSTKRQVHAWARKYLPEKVYFVGAHPMAGSEKRGVANARADLFKGCVCVITSGDKAAECVANLWRRIGAEVIYMTPDEHDRLVAFVSHLPHICAAVLVEAGLASPEARELAAGGFRDTTRVASSSPEVWRDICITNSDMILRAIEVFKNRLEQVAKIIKDGESDKLEEFFKQAKEVRDNLYASRSHSPPDKED